MQEIFKNGIQLNEDTFGEPSQNITLLRIRKSLKDRLRKTHSDKTNEELNILMKEILKIHGLEKDNFDFINVIGTLISEKLNDVSIDDNSNKNEKTVKGLLQEGSSPLYKAIGYDFLYRVIKSMYGKREAKRLMSLMYDFSLGMSDSTNILLPYCWSLDASKIITIGRDFGQLHSVPAKRVSSYISALCETIHQMSSHLAGAIAVGTFFLDIAHLMLYGKDKCDLIYLKSNPVVRKTLENEFQQFVHSVNHLSRNGNECVTEDTEVLTPTGFKKYNEVNVDDDIYTWKNGNLEIQKIQRVNIKDYDGKMHQYKGRDYNQIVTPNHNVLRKKFNSKDFELIESSKIFNNKTPESMPVAFNKTFDIDYNISDEMLKICTMVLNDGHFKSSGKDNYLIKIFKSNNRYGNSLIKETLHKLDIPFDKNIVSNEFPEKKYGKYDVNVYQIKVKDSKDIVKLLNGRKDILPNWMSQKLSQRQANIVLDIWQKFDGNNSDKIKMQCDNYDIANQLQQICVIAGYGSIIKERIIGDNKKPTIYINLYKRKNKQATEKNIIKYKGKVWCPTTENGIVVYRKDGRVFISGNSPFTNISIFDKIKLKSLIADDNMGWFFPDFDKNYVIDFITELQELFLEFFDKGDPTANGRPYRFPICTLNISKHKENDEYIISEPEFVKNICKKHDIYRYNIFTSEGTKISSCCRLISDVEMLGLASQSNSFGAGGSISLGSHRVVTTNFNRIALECDSLEHYYEILEKRVKDSSKILKAHRTLLTKMSDAGLHPFINNGWINMKRMFSTYGVLGIYEANETLKSKYGGSNHMKDILTFFNEKTSEYSKKEGIIHNIEQIPGESFAVRLCNVDKMLYGKDEVPYELYANQFVPLWEDKSIWEKLEIDGDMNQLLTGGGIVHARIGERITPNQSFNLIEYSIKTGCEHFALNAVYSTCNKDHTHFGKLKKCPDCGSDRIEYMERVVGFFVPISSWNKTRREWEFDKRTTVSF